MSRLFATEGAPDESWEFLEEVFDLEDQLAAVPERTLPKGTNAPENPGANDAFGSELTEGVR